MHICTPRPHPLCCRVHSFSFFALHWKAVRQRGGGDRVVRVNIPMVKFKHPGPIRCFPQYPGPINDCVDHVSDGGTPGSTVLCELTRDFHLTLSPPCVAEDSRSREGFHVCLDYGCPRLQLASSSSAPHASRCGKEKVLRGVLQHDQTSGAFFARTVPVYFYGRGGDAVTWMANSLCALRLHLPQSPPIFSLLAPIQ